MARIKEHQLVDLRKDLRTVISGADSGNEPILKNFLDSEVLNRSGKCLHWKCPACSNKFTNRQYY